MRDQVSGGVGFKDWESRSGHSENSMGELRFLNLKR